jgi:hypothetical protein
MKFIIRIILIGVICYFTANLLPWWSIAIVAATVSFLLPGNGFNVWLSGFLGVGLLWMAMAWKVDTESASIMSQKILELFPIKELGLLVITTGAIGGTVGAFSALTGSLFRKLFMKKKKKSYYN